MYLYTYLHIVAPALDVLNAYKNANFVIMIK